MSTEYIPNPAVSGYRLDSVINPLQFHTMDLTSDPWAGGKPQPLWGVEEKVLYEKRYGLGTFDLLRMKGFQGPSNEVKFIVIDTLNWILGRTPTEKEITDFQACGDSRYRDYLIQFEIGFRPDNPIHIVDETKPYGLIQGFNSFWKLNSYSFNDYTGQVDDEPPIDPVDPPPPPVDPPQVEVPKPPAFPHGAVRVLGNLGLGSMIGPTRVIAVNRLKKFFEEYDTYLTKL